MRKKKIVFFSAVGFGGAHNLIVNLAKRLKKHKVDIFLVLPNTEKNNIPLVKSIDSIAQGNRRRVKIFWIKRNRLPGIIGFYLTIFRLIFIHRKIANLIKRRNYNLLITTHCRYTQTPLLMWFTKSIPVIFLFCEPKREFYEPTSFDHYSFRRRLSRLLLLPIKMMDRLTLQTLAKNKKSLILAVSKQSLKTLKNIYGLPGKVFYPGVDTNRIKPINNSLNIKRKIKFLSVGSLNFHKGFDFIIEALSLLPYRFRNLTIVGNGGYDLNTIINLSKKYKIKLNVKTFITDRELLKEYQKAYLFLYAPRKEPFGIAVLEAMSCGLPVVALNSGGYVEILDRGKGGIFLSGNSPSQFAKYILKLIHDQKRYFKERRIARETAENFDWNTRINDFDKIIENFLE
jgi:glycosyltransferase involved in cell wall biosynthesis